MKLVYEDCFLYDEATSGSQLKLLNKIREINFAIVELNLFLDTHPHCKEAIMLFKKLCANKEVLVNKYQTKYGPLMVCGSKNDDTFDWVAKTNPWPWEKGGEN